MNRHVISGFALMASALSYAPAASAQAPQSAPVPVRNSLGQPNLEGNWVSATITPQTRLPEFGDRGVYTPKEVAEIEGTALRRAEAGDPDRVGGVGGPSEGTGGLDRKNRQPWREDVAAVLRW